MVALLWNQYNKFRKVAYGKEFLTDAGRGCCCSDADKQRGTKERLTKENSGIDAGTGNGNS